MSIVRQYDSLEAGQVGTFGYGWRLATADTDVETNVPLTGRENLGVYNPFRVGTRLYLNLPDGSRVGFTFTPVEHQEAGITYYTPAWMPDPGVTYTLQSVGDLLTLAGQRLYDLKTGVPYNPASGDFAGPQYALTAPDGTVYYLSTDGGVQEEITPSGDVLIYSGSGITNLATGDALSFVRGPQGQITSITGTDGHRLARLQLRQLRLPAARAQRRQRRRRRQLLLHPRRDAPARPARGARRHRGRSSHLRRGGGATPGRGLPGGGQPL